MIISKAVVVPTLILDLTMALTVGFALGYGVREWISRRRRQAERRRQGLGGGFWRRARGARVLCYPAAFPVQAAGQAALSRTGKLS